MMSNAALFLKKYALAAILCFGFLHGLVYVFMVPPWSHYDEPGHFEYVWMIATRPEIPARGEWDGPIRRAILASMIRNDFYKSIGPAPDLDTLSDPVPIGVTQVGDPPVYYWLASLPVRLLRAQPIETQLYAGRLVSLLFLLATIAVAAKFAEEISGQKSPLRWLIPFCVAAIPSLVDVMTALNNDAAAIFVYSAFLLIGARLIRRGFTIKYTLLLIACVVLGFFTKSSNWVLIVMLPFTLLLGLAHRKRTWLPWVIMVAGAAMAILLLFQWDDPALWLRDTKQAASARTSAAQVGLEGSMLQVFSAPERLNRLYQALPRSEGFTLRGQPVTIGVWMWADQPGQANLPQITSIIHTGDAQTTPAQVVELSTVPQFFAYHAEIPVDSNRLIFALNPFEGLSQPNQVYYYHPILAAGVYDTTLPPESLAPDASTGTWSGVQFINLVRNSAGEGRWPRPRPAVVSLSGKIDSRLEETINWTISLLDLQGTGWYIQTSLGRLFRTFWATFGWGAISLSGSRPYRIPLFFTAIGLLGAVIALYRRSDKTRLILSGWLLSNILLELAFALYTGVSMGSITGRAYLPVARFIFPTTLAIAAILAIGWVTCIKLLPGRFQKAGWMILVAFFLILDVASILTVQTYWG